MKTTIGASEIAAVLGCDPYVTPEEQYARTRDEASAPDNEHITRGRVFESALLDWWEILEGRRLARHDTRGAHSQDARQLPLVHPCGYARATLDGLTEDGRTIVEVKCPAAYRNWNEREGRYPFQYHVQVVWQLGVAAACGHSPEYAELCAGPIYGRLLRFRVMPDPEFFRLALARAEEFLQHVREGTPLPATFTTKEATP